jgi:hypothetical protein
MTHRVMNNAHKILVGKLQRKHSVWRPKCGWKDNIKIDLNK